MRRLTLITIIIQLVNWYIQWPLGWKILFTVFGIATWLLVYAIKTAKPDPNMTMVVHEDDEVLW